MPAPDIQGLAHFSIPVSNVEASEKFYTDIVGCKHLFTTPPKTMSFLDAGGACIILCQHEAPINPVLDDHNGVHHSFKLRKEDFDAALDNLRANGVSSGFCRTNR